jgi:hypothetical protein
MKKMMMIAAMMLMSIGAFAQNEVGQFTLQPKVGINIANITADFQDKKSKVGLIAGVEGEYGVAENFSLTAGLLYSMEGCKSGDLKFNLDYINIPIMAQYYVVKGLAVKAGIQPAFNVRHKASLNGTSVDINDAIGVYGSKVQSFNFSVPVGLSYEYESFVLDARYNIGATKIFKNSNQGRNSTVSITLGYKFEL